MTRAQYYSRVHNIQKNLNNDTEKGEQIRSEFYRVTKRVKYRESTYRKSDKKYKFREVSKIVIKIEKKRKAKLKARWKKLGKPTTWKKFQRTNKHLVDYEIEHIEFYYDSP